MGFFIDRYGVLDTETFVSVLQGIDGVILGDAYAKRAEQVNRPTRKPRMPTRRATRRG